MTGQLWFVLSNGREFGPLSQAEILALVSQNAVSRDAMVSVDRVNWQMLQHAVGGMAQASFAIGPVAPVRPYIPTPQPAPPLPTFSAPPSYGSTSTKKPPNRAKLLIWLSSVGFLGAIASWCLGFFAFPFAILAPISWWMAASELASIRRGQLSPKGTGTLQVAVTNGLLGTIVFGVWLLVLTLGIVGMATSGEFP